jgi:predicted MFS family arabinose efflux permease
VWVEVAVVATGFAIGNILFGHFEERTPKWRRILKFIIVVGLTIGLSSVVGRRWTFIILALLLIAPLIVHVWWLPKHGINGWTGEPKDKYYELRGWKRPPTT